MEKLRLALVGPADSVALTYPVALEWKDQIVSTPFVYKNAAEVPDIVRQHLEEFDFWLFSGISPYKHAQRLGLNIPCFYIPHIGSSLYRALLQITHMAHLEIDSISFDTFNRQEIEETFLDANMPLPKLFLHETEDIVTSAELTDYHYQLWQSGQSHIAVTCYLATYEKLKELGVPVFRIWPTRSNIRTTIEVALSAVRAERFKGGQLAIQQIMIDDYDDMVRNSSSYAAKKIELRLYEILVDYAKQLQGSIIVRGDGQYTLYSTRGILEKWTEELTVLPCFDEITRQVSAKVSGGIGFGPTAYVAEENAFHALGLAKRAGKGMWMAVTDSREAVGPLSSPTHLKYSLRASDSVCQHFAEKLNLSRTTVNKLFAALDQLKRDTLAADDLAFHLGITTRSARRLLTTLASQDLADVTGEELLSKGRPRKLYSIHWQKLLQPAIDETSPEG